VSVRLHFRPFHLFSALRCASLVFRHVLQVAPAAATLVIFPFCAAQAQTMEPNSYTNAPIGLNFLIAGYSHQSGSVLVDPSLPISNVKATVDGEFLAYSRAIACWGQSGNFALVLPYASLSASGDVFEQSKSVDRNGFGDATLRLSVNLFGAPALSLKQFPGYHQDTIVGVTLTVTAPTGQYIASKLVNIGTHRWSFMPALGVSKAVGRWTLESSAGVTFFSDNEQFYGDNVRHQDLLFSVQAHAIYNFTPKMWASLDGTYYTGGRTSVNGNLNNNLLRDSRWGGTFAYSLTLRNSIKLYFSSGLADRTGTDFKVFGIAWQHRWGAGL
jgi:hypothetical protein